MRIFVSRLLCTNVRNLRVCVCVSLSALLCVHLICSMVQKPGGFNDPCGGVGEGGGLLGKCIV